MNEPTVPALCPLQELGRVFGVTVPVHAAEELDEDEEVVVVVVVVRPVYGVTEAVFDEDDVLEVELLILEDIVVALDIRTAAPMFAAAEAVGVPFL